MSRERSDQRSYHSRPCPSMIPNLRWPSHAGSRPYPLRRRPCILNWNTTSPLRYTPGPNFQLCFSEQPTSVPSSHPQLLVCGSHGIILSLQLKFPSLLYLRAVKVPCSMYCPVAQCSIPGEAQRSGSKGCWVVQVVADKCYTIVRYTDLCIDRKYLLIRLSTITLPLFFAGLFADVEKEDAGCSLGCRVD